TVRGLGRGGVGPHPQADARVGGGVGLREGQGQESDHRLHAVSRTSGRSCLCGQLRSPRGFGVGGQIWVGPGRRHVPSVRFVESGEHGLAESD
ncbi:unnamed protein product, partial [Prorocentrum cordatum]